GVGHDAARNVERLAPGSHRLPAFLHLGRTGDHSEFRGCLVDSARARLRQEIGIRRRSMRTRLWALFGVACLATPAAAQTADEIMAKYLQAVGGLDKIHAVQTLRRTGKYLGGGGFEAAVTQENKRTNQVREEFLLQDLVGINAYDGKVGWKVEPWNGKKDP